jgi:hypothetical protein
MSRRHQRGFLLRLVLVVWSGLSGGEYVALAASGAPRQEGVPLSARLTKTELLAPARPIHEHGTVVRRKDVEQPDTVRLQARKGKKVIRRRYRRPSAVFSKPNLSYHGLVEESGRYNPSPVRRKGGIPNPEAEAVRHDHFQELDRNHDGLLDPFERVSGRLDIDRDLPNRRRD